MRVFVSSLMSGDFGLLREAAASAIRTLGHEPARAEDYTVSPSSPQAACLAGVRTADAVVLILGSEYGSCQDSGLSATHEEYREARESSRPVLAFIEEDAEPTGEQAAFIREVQDWERGHYTASFRSGADLQAKVTRGLHQHLLADAAAPLDENELAERARALIPARTDANWPLLVLAIASGPSRQVLRPAELESEELRRYMQSEALTGPFAVLSLSSGTTSSIHKDTITLEQHDTAARVTLSETGSIIVAQAAIQQDSWQSGIPSIIEEQIAERIAHALRFAGRVLDHVDPHQRISHVAIVTAVLGAGFMPWRTREEQARSPHSATIGLQHRDRVEATLSPPTRRRATLAHDAQRLSEDLTVRLRRESTAYPTQ